MLRWSLLILSLSNVLQSVLSQDADDISPLLNNLPICGQSCFKGSLDKSESFGCNKASLTCLCINQGFGADVERGCKAGCTNITDLESTENGVRNICGALAPKVEVTSTIISQSSKSTITQTVVQTITPVSFVIVAEPSPSGTADSLDMIPLSSSIPSGSASTIFPTSSPSLFQSLPPTFSPTANISSISTSSMPTSQKIGVGVSIPIGIGIGIASFFLIMKRFRRKRHRDNTVPNHRRLSPIMTQPPQLPKTSVGYREPGHLNSSPAAGAWVDGIWIADIGGLTESPESPETWATSTTAVESPGSLLEKNLVQDLSGGEASHELMNKDH